jgi:hypothetical protein
VLPLRGQTGEAGAEAVKRSSEEFRGGFIKLHRSLLSSSIWDSTPESWARVFIALLLLASWRSSTWWDGTKEILLEPGSVVTSVKHLATISGVSEKQVRGCLKFLQTAGIAAIKTANKYTLVVITNWSTYQTDNTQEGDQSGKHEGNQTASGRQSNGDILRSLRRERSISPQTPQGVGAIQLPAKDAPLVEAGEEILVRFTILERDRSSLANALYRLANEQDTIECIADGGSPGVFGGDSKHQSLGPGRILVDKFPAPEEAVNGGWGDDPVPDNLRAALGAEIDSWPAPPTCSGHLQGYRGDGANVQNCTTQRAREAAA